MSIGIGACNAAQTNANSSTITGQQHLQGIRNVSFHSASSEMFRFSPNSTDRPGVRDPSTSLWALMNFVDQATSNYESLYDANVDYGDSPGGIIMRPVGYRGGKEDWDIFDSVVYASNSTIAPDLRDLPDQNYLSPGLQAFGLSLMSFTILLGLVTIVWVFVHRKHPVLLAAQPMFLYLIAFGSILFSLTIFSTSFDESYGWSEDQLNRACVSQSWLISVGYMIIYGAMYSKLWRVNRALQFTRRRVGLYRAVLPFAILLVLTVIILTVTTIVAPVEWERDVIDEETGASMGRCGEDGSGIVILLMIIITIMAGCYAWRTRDVDSAYSESWWILMLILLQLELYIVAIPVVMLLEDVSTDGFYFGNVILAFLFPMTTLLFIMLPKVAAHHRAVHPEAHTNHIRGNLGHGSICVSGLPNSQGGAPGSSNAATRGSSSTHVIELTGPSLQEAIAQGRSSPTEQTHIDH